MNKPIIDAAVAAALAQAIAPAELSQTERRAMHDRILARIHAPPPPLTQTIRATEMSWVSAGPGVEVMVLRSSDERNDQTVLIRMQPGSVVVGHRHTQEEECLILEGEVFIGEHRLMRGDMHVAHPGAVHEPIRAPHGALLLIRSERPPQHFKIA
jgi:anti-sigma factor ChrR (cupin superfamily)